MAEIDPSALNGALRRLHRSAIVSLGLCGAAVGFVALSGGDASPEDGATRPYSWIALGLAALAILLRRRAVTVRRSLRAFVYGTVLSLLGAVGLGLLGLVVALREGQVSVGLLYTLAGAILVLRPPPQLRTTPSENAGASANGGT